jgi:LEA14-like dessication related protein
MNLALLAAATLSITGTGCSMFMHSIEEPKASVQHVSVGAAGWGGATGKLDLDVTNPNNFGVPLSGIDWTLSIDGSRAITGRTELSATIPAHGHAPVSTSLSIDARDAIARDYRLDAKLHFSTGFSKVDVEISNTGTLGG